MSQRNRTNNRKFKSFDDDAFYEDWDNNRKNTKNPRRELVEPQRSVVTDGLIESYLGSDEGV